MFYVYILKNKKKKTWTYVGSTNNLERRLQEHVNGFSKYTKSYLPIYLESFIAVRTETKGRELEKYFKTGSGIAILKKRILSNEAF